jgi:hypothetical protein
MNWFTSPFSAESQGGDLVDSSPLNITKITALLVPLTTAAIATLDAAVFKDDGILSGLTPGQKLALVFSLIAFVAIIIVTDMMTRARATAALLGGPVALLPAGIKGKVGAEGSGSRVLQRGCAGCWRIRVSWDTAPRSGDGWNGTTARWVAIDEVSLG